MRKKYKKYGLYWDLVSVQKEDEDDEYEIYRIKGY